MPKATGIQGYPTQGESASYSGLYSFACNYGNCIAGVCGTVEVPLDVPTVSPFTPGMRARLALDRELLRAFAATPVTGDTGWQALVSD